MRVQNIEQAKSQIASSIMLIHLTIDGERFTSLQEIEMIKYILGSCGVTIKSYIESDLNEDMVNLYESYYLTDNKTWYNFIYDIIDSINSQEDMESFCNAILDYSKINLSKF